VCFIAKSLCQPIDGATGQRASKRSSWRKEDDEIEEDEDEKKGNWKSWVRDIVVAVIILVVVLAAIYAYTQVWPPLVVVESSSMQHGDTTSYIGVIDTGDLVFVQASPIRGDVITYLQGRATGYSTYGDYGDVIIFRLARDSAATPIIHRAIMYVIPNGSSADVPDLTGLPQAEWQGYRNGTPVSGAYGLTSVTILQMGYDHNLGITFNLAYFVQTFGGHSGYITMGDNNADNQCAPVLGICSGQTYDTSWFPAQGDIIGHARGEIPWFGLIKLLLSPSPKGCARGWGDPCAPANSWNDLAISIVVLIALPFLVEGAVWAWSKYAWPRIKPHLPRIRGRKPVETPKEEVPPPEENEELPREGSSGP
jgi:signal peptidase